MKIINQGNDVQKKESRARKVKQILNTAYKMQGEVIMYKSCTKIGKANGKKKQAARKEFSFNTIGKMRYLTL
ncbi:hypothetical protein AAHA92_01855 [Salvia divinorum]|uniref:Uncharacterized protein n=1 Tax=Salvia divinorum TaxID=28513 RepID=A0ABD1ICY3_SALDI